MRHLNLRLAIAFALASSSLLLAGGALARDYGNIDKVNSSITIESDSTAGDLETVNGSIRIGDNSRAREVSTVNGGIRLGDNAQADSVETVNGGITIGAEAVVGGGVEAVNGGVTLEAGAEVAGRVENVNGGIELERAHVAGGISTVSGDVTIGDGSRVEGGVLVEKPSMGWFNSQPQRPPRIVIGAGAVVEGTLRFEREVELYVHDSAKIGAVEGAQAKRYSGERPPL